MKRNVDLAEISDGRVYKLNDMVKADCHGCKGCYKCCTGMGNSVVLDPYDVYRLQKGLRKETSQMLAEGAAELSVTGGVILLSLKMAGREERCVFLNQEGRCGIHEFRPGLCRLFPLGRVYDDNGDFQYFLQTKECQAPARSKIKVSKWIDTPDQEKNDNFVRKWHSLLKHLEEAVGKAEDLEKSKRLNLRMIQTFFMKPYETKEDFYRQFEERLEIFRCREETA